jgi:hypothetical protein
MVASLRPTPSKGFQGDGRKAVKKRDSRAKTGVRLMRPPANYAEKPVSRAA